MTIIENGIPSPHGLRLIIGIGVPAIPGRWRFVQIYVGLFCIDHNYRESNPCLFLGEKHRLCYQCNGCIRPHPRDDRNVFNKAPVGHWLGTELVTREIVDATIIWQAHTLSTTIVPYIAIASTVDMIVTAILTMIVGGHNIDSGYGKGR